MLVTFDPGRNLGVCRAMARDKRQIVFGQTLYCAKLRDTTDLGAFLKSADDPIREALRGASRVGVEQPNTQGANHSGIVKLCALYGLICYWATHHGLKVEPINLRHAKTFLCDNGNAKKPEMVSAAEFQLGLPAGTLDDNSADAFGLWLVASFGVPVSASQRAAAAATRRRLEREAAKAAKEAAKVRAQDPLF